MRVRSGVALGAKALVTGIILWIVLSRAELLALTNALSQINLWFVVAALSLSLPMGYSGVQRWRSVAAAFGEKLSFGPAFIYTWIGLFVNLAVPLLGLDAVRTWKLHQRGTPLGLAARIVIIDRLCSLVSLLLIISIGVPHLANLAGGTFFKNVVFLALVCGTLGLALVATAQFFENSYRRDLRRLFQISRDFNHALFNNKRATVTILLWAACNHFCRVAMVICIAFGLDLTLSSRDAFVLVPASLLIAMLPISIAGWGVREVVFIEALSLVGIASANALVLSILYGLIGLMTGLIGGVIWIAERNLSETTT
jgi:uncharacterized membrane protein YbhN (UPF0104 family)